MISDKSRTSPSSSPYISLMAAKSNKNTIHNKLNCDLDLSILTYDMTISDENFENFVSTYIEGLNGDTSIALNTYFFDCIT